MRETDCEHCYPERRNHFLNKIFNLIEYFIVYPFVTILSKTFLLSEQDFINFNHLLHKLCIIVFQKIKLLCKTNVIERTQLNKTVLAYWDEGNNRRLELYNFKESRIHTPYFMLVLNSKKYYFIQTPISLIYQKINSFESDIKYDNKWTFKKKLLENRIPCPLGKMFISSRKAYNYGLSLGFPLTVKPVSESLSIHVSCNINTPSKLKEAIKIVKQIDCRVLVEQHIPGDVYRALILDNSLIACVRRQPGQVIGNGVNTIQALIDRKKMGKNVLDYYTYFLKSQGISLDTILSKGQQIFISNKVTLSTGSTITDVTCCIHPENREFLEQVHKILNIPLSGLDLICTNISQPWHQQPFGIIENNSFPYIDLHLHTAAEKPINVAGKIWDYVLNVLNQTKGSDL